MNRKYNSETYTSETIASQIFQSVANSIITRINVESRYLKRVFVSKCVVIFVACLLQVSVEHGLARHRFRHGQRTPC